MIHIQHRRAMTDIYPVTVQKDPYPVRVLTV